MTYPTPEQERAAEERVSAFVNAFVDVTPDGGIATVQNNHGPSPRLTKSDLALLLSVVERQREALKFYADPGEWGSFELGEVMGSIINPDDWEVVDGDLVGGKTARAALGESNDA